MASSPPNGSAHGNGAIQEVSTDPQQSAADASNSTGPIAEAQALKEALRDAYGCAGRLVAALKRQRKQSRLVASTLASLRELQHIGG